MSLRAKCLPQKSGLQLSATKQTTFNTSVKRTSLKHRLGREKNLSISSKKNQLRKNRPAITTHHRNGRSLLKSKTTTTKSSTTTTSKNKEKIVFKQKQGATTKNKTSKIKNCTRAKLENFSSSINCSRSGRKLVPARCACANDSVTTRCSIHNNVRKTATSNISKSKSSQNHSNNTKRESQEILRAKQISTTSKNKKMSSMTIPIQQVSSTATSSSLKSSVAVCNNIDAQHLNNCRDNDTKQKLFHPQQNDEPFNSTLNTTDDAILEDTTNKSESTDKTKTTATVPGLPSPTNSISETSDYQRSTPSPKDELDSSMATTVSEWSAESSSRGGEATNDPDPGFEDDENKHDICQTNGTRQVPLVLQQLCAALTKIPESKRSPIVTQNKSAINSLPPTNLVNNNTSASKVSPKLATSLPTSNKESLITHKSITKSKKVTTNAQNAKSILGKRRKSLQLVLQNDSSSNCANLNNQQKSEKFKKRKGTDVNIDDNVTNIKTANTTIGSNTSSHHQGKITEYLPEMKDSFAMAKKEKLDKITTASMYNTSSTKNLSQDTIVSKIKTEDSAIPSAILSIIDVEEEGVLVIDDKENVSTSQERDDEEDENQRNFTSEILNHTFVEDTKRRMTENDLKNTTEHDIKISNDMMSLKPSDKYSNNHNTKSSSMNISPESALIAEQLPFDVLVKDEDQKLLSMSPLPCSSSSSGISSSSSASLKDDSSSVISSSRMSSSSSSGASSYTKDYDHLFEMPRTIRFPPPNAKSAGSVGLNRSGGMSVTRISRSDSTENATNNNNLTETVICRWELCGQEFDSSGKLLDHLKTVHATIDYTNKSTNINNSYEELEGEKDLTNQTKSSIQYKCLWEGCKVYGKGSSSRSWLEKHVVANHGGNKPFQCIVDDCKERFGTQSLLERHVNSHFKCKAPSTNSTADNNSNLSTAMHSSSSSIASSNHHNSNKLSKNSLSSNMNGHNRLYHSKLSRANKKLMAPNGKRLKYRKTIYSARIFDLFDLGVMAQVRQKITAFESGCRKLRSESCAEQPIRASRKVKPKKTPKLKEAVPNKVCDSSTKSQNSVGVLDQMIEFRSEVLAKRTDKDGQVRVLLQWIPNGIFENEWSLMKDALNTKHIKMSSLSSQQRAILSNEILQLGDPVSKTETVLTSEKKARKTKAPQSRSSALS